MWGVTVDLAGGDLDEGHGVGTLQCRLQLQLAELKGQQFAAQTAAPPPLVGALVGAQVRDGEPASGRQKTGTQSIIYNEKPCRKPMFVAVIAFKYDINFCTSLKGRSSRV